MSDGLLKYAACQNVGFVKVAEMEKQGFVFSGTLLALSLLGAYYGGKDVVQGAKKVYKGEKGGWGQMGVGGLSFVPGVGTGIRAGKGIHSGYKAYRAARGLGRSLGSSATTARNVGSRTMQQAGRMGIGSSGGSTGMVSPGNMRQLWGNMGRGRRLGLGLSAGEGAQGLYTGKGTGEQLFGEGGLFNLEEQQLAGAQSPYGLTPGQPGINAMSSQFGATPSITGAKPKLERA